MVDAGAVDAYCFPVDFGGVSFVLRPAVMGKIRGQPGHVLIPECFGQDGSGCNGGIFPVALDHAMEWQVLVRYEPIPVDEQGFRRQACLHRPPGEL